MGQDSSHAHLAFRTRNTAPPPRSQVNAMPPEAKGNEIETGNGR
eukprot:CAMPEP_0202835406 /NCGR_PEP_ID=MMETSP1389-20130828/36562_1 /ASSEMBLY_ACC=CAM_ASM_000865 /TAXON_ID=302021 /ORGANISM="Rhodomonas sp., Strain CCMP768" /LENGTH=43 /DNA_ID= /DNA_START= /DNA_END= /DNA_ORIENTATION=